jgi:hypothetical protein
MQGLLKDFKNLPGPVNRLFYRSYASPFRVITTIMYKARVISTRAILPG